MERLTEWSQDHTHGQILRGDAATKLCRYEDTGLEPEEIKLIGDLKQFKHEIIFGVTLDRLRELADADKDGRCMVLPCKVGDTVYLIGAKYRGGSVEKWINTGKFRMSDYDNIGKTVFLTREAAEAALEGTK